MKSIRLIAPAKVNWTLEVLGKRPDGYHEIRSVMQTIDLCDTVTLTVAPEVSLEVLGLADDTRLLLRQPIASNLAHRAAALLREHSRQSGGVHIEIEKRVPVAAGLGGGSSDAAAVLRGLRMLWQLDLSDEDLAAVGAELGSDVPFFVFGGYAMAAGRGELIQPSPTANIKPLVLAWPSTRIEEKTPRMYAALRAEHFREPGMAPDEGIFNTFELVIGQVDPESGALFDRVARLGLGTPRLCGSGPAMFLLVPEGQVDNALAALRSLGLEALATRTTTAGEATTMLVDG